MVWQDLTNMLLKLLHPFICYSLSKDRCSAWKLLIYCFDYENFSYKAIFPSYIFSLDLALIGGSKSKILNYFLRKTKERKPLPHQIWTKSPYVVRVPLNTLIVLMWLKNGVFPREGKIFFLDFRVKKVYHTPLDLSKKRN